MIVTLIAVVAFISGIIFYVITDRFDSSDLLSAIGLFLLASGFVVSLLCSGAIIDMNVGKDIDYQNKLDERELIEYRIEDKGRNFVSDGKLYNDIVEFNNSLRKEKEGANSPWTNWFYNDDIATIDYIEVEE